MTQESNETTFRYVNHDADGDDNAEYTVTGTIVGHGDNVDDGKDRWVVVDIIRTASGEYAVHRAGESRVYHRADNTTCKTRRGTPMGSKATRADLPPGAVSCDVCEPPWQEDLEDDDEVLFEFPRHSVKAFATPDDVRSDLYRIRGGQSGSRGQHASKPSRRALADARGNDPAFEGISIGLDIR
jgi:hypothetical protein